MNVIIKKGDKFRCKKDFVMDSGEVAYIKGRVYTSNKNGNLPDEILDAHEMEYIEESGDDPNEFWEHFEKVDSDVKALRYNSDKAKYNLLDLKSMEPGVKVLEFGAKKYAPNNWKKGMPLSEIIDSMMRHIACLQSGEWLDKESGLPHIGHIQCNALFMGGPNVVNDMTEKCCGNWNSDGECKCNEI